MFRFLHFILLLFLNIHIELTQSNPDASPKNRISASIKFNEKEYNKKTLEITLYQFNDNTDREVKERRKNTIKNINQLQKIYKSVTVYAEKVSKLQQTAIQISEKMKSVPFENHTEAGECCVCIDGIKEDTEFALNNCLSKKCYECYNGVPAINHDCPSCIRLNNKLKKIKGISKYMKLDVKEFFDKVQVNLKSLLDLEGSWNIINNYDYIINKSIQGSSIAEDAQYVAIEKLSKFTDEDQTMGNEILKSFEGEKKKKNIFKRYRDKAKNYFKGLFQRKKKNE
ncbi:hypothetical protein SNEBB_005936 [Seison nebaliae]|nr:hypothetical protein SNEBB_005936 [Seison nebaliae]